MTKAGYHKDKQRDSMAMAAADWAVRLQSESMTPEAEAEFNAWLSENPAHQAELDLMDIIWDRYDDLKEHPTVVGEMAAAWGRNRWTSLQELADRFKMGMPRIRFVAVAAAVLLIVAAVWLVPSDIITQKTYRTAIGEQKVIALADGSTVHLDTATEMSAMISSKVRRIDLKAGRALFSVSYDPERPFVVTTGQTVVEALGTEFDVFKTEEGRIFVAVLRGRVQVSRKANTETPDPGETSEVSKKTPDQSQEKTTISSESIPRLSPQILVPGQELTVDEGKEISEVKSADIKRIEAWRSGKLDFEGIPFAEAVDEMNRYLEAKLVIGDNQLKDIRISMIFNVSDSKFFLDTLKKTLPVRSETLLNGQILLLKKGQT